MAARTFGRRSRRGNCGFRLFGRFLTGIIGNDVRSSGSAEGTHAGLELLRNITGRSFAGTPIAVRPAGTSLITNELAATVASSPIVTAPMMLA